jgi:hypothetical protein
MLNSSNEAQDFEATASVEGSDAVWNRIGIALYPAAGNVENARGNQWMKVDTRRSFHRCEP